jgi:Amt family ammonium transporter
MGTSGFEARQQGEARMISGRIKWAVLGCIALVFLLGMPPTAQAQEELGEATETVKQVAPEAAAEVVLPEVPEGAGYHFEAVDGAPVLVNGERFTIDNLWVMIAACLVFIMHLGFAMVESGLTRAKNTINILFKNAIIVCIGLFMYAIVGFALMYPGAGTGQFGFAGNGYFGFAGIDFLFLGTQAFNDPSLMTEAYGLQMTTFTDFFFQAIFAATCCTIVSGAVAERVKLAPFLVFCGLFVGVAYNITGYWKWGGGWLNELGFYDFAGSTLVHSVGGWAALVGATVLGPRLGKYAKDGSVQPIPGHSMPLATIGVLLLWFGWFGFNGGSVLSANPQIVSLVMVTTALAGAAGGLATTVVSWIGGGKPDLSMALNGMLAGLVGITAGADQMAVWEALVIGGIAGTLVYFAVIFFDKLRIDDPVGAISVHLVCGVWGTLAVGLFGAKAGLAQLGYQLTGIAAIGAFTVVFAAVVFLVLKHTVGLRVSTMEEYEGLDLGEHDMAAYPDFQHTYIKSYHAREI